ncbi:MAG: hypothetical protein ACYSWO_12220 [Planctomycetota bacterium]
MESFAREHPPQQTVAPNMTYVSGCCVGFYANPAAATDGGEVCPTAVAEKVTNMFEREERAFREVIRRRDD